MYLPKEVRDIFSLIGFGVNWDQINYGQNHLPIVDL